MALKAYRSTFFHQKASDGQEQVYTAIILVLHLMERNWVEAWCGTSWFASPGWCEDGAARLGFLGQSSSVTDAMSWNRAPSPLAC